MKWWNILLFITLLIVTCWFIYTYFRTNIPVDEGFQSTPGIVTEALLHPSDIVNSDSATSYTIFDPTAAYVQADIYEAEYSGALNQAYSKEKNTINDALSYFDRTVRLECDYVRGYRSGACGDIDITYDNATQPPEVYPDLYRIISLYNKSDLGKTAVKGFYDEILMNFIRRYNFSSRFKNHPIGFILSNMKPSPDGFINCSKPKVDISSGISGPWGIYRSTYGNTHSDAIFRTTVASGITPVRVYSPTRAGALRSVRSLRDHLVLKSLISRIKLRYYRDPVGTNLFEAYNEAMGGSYKDLDSRTSADNSQKDSCLRISNEASVVIDSSILSNTLNWTVKSFVTTSPLTNTLRGGVTPNSPALSTTLSSKIKSEFETSKIGQRGNQLYKTLSLTGTISDTNKQEIRNSIRYAMYFNFTDTSKTESQICVSKELPCNLYVFNDCSGMSEFVYVKGKVIVNTPGITHNSTRRIQFQDNMFKLLPYHTRDYIRRWAINRRKRVAKFYSEAEAATIITRTYNEIKGDTSSEGNNPDGTRDIAPKYDLMSIANTRPTIYMIKTASTIVGTYFVFRLYNASTNKNTSPGTYTTSLTFSTSIKADFLKSDINVVVSRLTVQDTYFFAVIDSYNSTTGELKLKNINMNTLLIAGKVFKETDAGKAMTSLVNVWNPFVGTTDFYTVEYVDMASINVDTSQSETVAPVIINPNTSSVTLNIPLQNADNPIFSVNDNVVVSKISDSNVYFKGKVSTVGLSGSYTSIEINTITNITGNFSTISTYVITKGDSVSKRFWLTATEKKSIVNKIAQKYYDLNNGTKDMKRILDIFQVGDTIFDVRFTELERDVQRTAVIHKKIGDLYKEHALYRTYNLSEEQLLDLNTSYTAKMIELNTDLNNAIRGNAENCGVNARYVRIRRTDTNTTGIELSQVVVIDSKGNNVANNSRVIASTTFLYDYETPDLYIYQSPSGATIDSTTGSVKDSAGNVIAQNMCVPMSRCIRDASTGVVSVLKPTDQSGETSDLKIKRMTRNQYLVNGKLKATVAPYIFKTAGSSTNEYVTIDLSTMTEITNVMLYFPYGYAETPTYEITFMDNEDNSVRISSEITSNLITKRPTSVYEELIVVAPSRISKTDVPSCPTTLLNPTKVARFYATIDSSYQDGYPSSNMSKISFTGYSIGVEAALTFNPMYNAGFEINLTSFSGNMGIKPVITYNLHNGYRASSTATTDTPVMDLNTMCNDNNMLINIMRDYMMNISSASFLNRADIVRFRNDYTLVYEDKYSYRPYNIESVKQFEPGKCGIVWKEKVIDTVTNKVVQGKSDIGRYGVFKYVKNTETWAGIDIYYDVSNSIIYEDRGAYDRNHGGVPNVDKNLAIPELLPYEDVLDDLDGLCPMAKCSDTEVIRQLVNQYNDNITDSNNQITRVTKAVTPSNDRCDYAVKFKNNQSRNVTFKVVVENKSSAATELEAGNSECKYRLESYDTSNEAGQFIQSNTPTIAKVYNYVKEIMNPYVKSIENIKDSLTMLISDIGIDAAALNYTKDTYGAFGQVYRLSGCRDTDTGNKCSDVTVMNEFIKKYNADNIGISRIVSITNAGTANQTTCDYAITVSPVTKITYNNNSIKAETLSPTSQVVRATMSKNNVVPTSCMFDVVSLTNNTSRTSISDIKELKQVSFSNQTSPWITPVPIITQETSGLLTFTGGSSVSLKIPNYTFIRNKFPSVIGVIPQEYNPSGLPSLEYWYDGNDSATVSGKTWRNKANKPGEINRDLTFKSASQTAIDVSYDNTNKAVNLDGTQYFELVNEMSFMFNNPYSFFFVETIESKSTGGEHYLLTGTNGDKIQAILTRGRIFWGPRSGTNSGFLEGVISNPELSFSSNIRRMWRFSYDNTTSTYKIYLNGNLINSKTNSNPSSESIKCFFRSNRTDDNALANGAHPYRGKVHEIIVCSTNNVNELDQIEGYLAWKWGLRTQLPSTHPWYVKSPKLIVTLYRRVNVVDVANSQNNFDADIDEYNSSNGGTIVLKNIVNKYGTYDKPTRYSIRDKPPVVSLDYSITDPIESVDYIDCKLQLPTNTMINASAFTCKNSANNAHFTYTKNSSDVWIGASTSEIPNPITVVNIGTNTNSGASVRTTTVTSIDAQALYQSILGDVPQEAVTSDTYDYRVTSNDSLPFSDIYKRITFQMVGSALRIKRVVDAPITSGFAFFKKHPVSTTDLMSKCANALRDYWNVKNNGMSETVNKSIIGNITGYYYKQESDSIVFRAIACDYGINGPNDIRRYSDARYFEGVFRKQYGKTDLTYSSTSTTNTIIVYSVEELASAPTSVTSFSSTYTSTSLNYTKDYNAGYRQRSLRDELMATHNFRFLRFKITKTPVSSTAGEANRAEITQINFYKKNTGTTNVNTTPIVFKSSKFSVDGLSDPFYDVYNTNTPMIYGNTTTKQQINPSNGSSVTIATIKISGTSNFSVGMKVLVYDYDFPQRYFRGTISNVIASNVTTVTVNSISGVTGGFTTQNNYSIIQDTCDDNYSITPDIKKIADARCVLNNVPTYTMNSPTNVHNIGGVSVSIPCSIGYDLVNMNQCRLNGIFSSVNMQRSNPNIGTPRLKLNIGQYLYIDLNAIEVIDFYDFMTGVSNSRPLQWVLEGSISGNRNVAQEWITLHSVTGDYAYPEATAITAGNVTIYSFLETKYFSILSTDHKTKPSYTSSTKNYLFDPTTYSGGTTVFTENFQNPTTILDIPSEPHFRRRVPRLENSFTLPLQRQVHTVDERMPFHRERRIQYLRFKIIETRDKSDYVHMSNFKIITPLGALPTTHYKITNPMGIHPIRGSGPDALNNPGQRWVCSNRQPLLIKFYTLPATTIQGFQFSAPTGVGNPFDAVPSEWIMEASYDGRLWEVYHETDNPSVFYEYESPVYKFFKEI